MMVALVVSGTPIAGWILHPVSGALYAGERGSGVRLTDARGCTTRPERPPRTSIAELVGLLRQDWPRHDPRRAITTHASRLAGVLPLTSAGRNYVRMITGEADFLINFSVNAWDHLPGLLLVSEMGLRYGRVDGTPYHPAEQGAALLSAPANLWRDVRNLLIDPLTESQGRS
jgi:fructose-1,6-bisphosphatase/inositol monophosphatase family enzyme